MGVIRKIRPSEAFKLEAHMLRLSADDRRQRFGHPVKESFVIRFVRSIDWASSVHLGYFEDGEIRGAGQLVWPALGASRGAEMAVQVEAPWRRRGIGGEFIRRMSLIARNRGLESLHINTLSENQPVRRLAVRYGIALKRFGTELEGQVGLMPPDHRSFVAEAMAEDAGGFDAVSDDGYAVLHRPPVSPPVMRQGLDRDLAMAAELRP